MSHVRNLTYLNNRHHDPTLVMDEFAVDRRPASQTLTGRILTMRVTDKGQVTIPKDVRDQFGIGPGSEVTFEVVDGEIVVRKVVTGVTRGQQLAERLRGRGDVSMTTDEIMALTRGG